MVFGLDAFNSFLFFNSVSQVVFTITFVNIPDKVMLHFISNETYDTL